MPRRFALALCLPLALAAAAFAATPTPPTDDQIDTFIKSIDAAKAPEGADAAATAAAKRQARRDAAKEGLKDLAIAEATLPQLQKLVTKRAATASSDVAEAVDTRLVTLAKDTGADGAKAAELRMQVVPTPDKPGADAMKARSARIAELAAETLKHPGAAAMFKSGGGENLLRSIAAIPSSDPKGAAELFKQHNLIESVTPFITSDLSPALVSSLSRLTHALVETKDNLGKDVYETFRTRLSDAAAAALPKAVKDRDEQIAKFAQLTAPEDDDKAAVESYKKAEAAKTTAESMVTRMKDTRTLLDGPWARGQLIDHAAPQIAFTWSNSEKPIKSFADLKGKVVLVDFWATWCGPCRAAFPKLRDLQTRYSGYPVVILGVTSDQGSHTDVKNKKKIDCKGDPDKEHALMPEFMRDMEMNWTVAFSEQNVFNPAFGVRGIPHIAIIDAEGKVRFNALYPNPKEESEHIDALLKEAKLPYPEAPYVEPKKEEKKDEAKKDDAKPDAPKKDDGKKN